MQIVVGDACLVHEGQQAGQGPQPGVAAAASGAGRAIAAARFPGTESSGRVSGSAPGDEETVPCRPRRSARFAESQWLVGRHSSLRHRPRMFVLDPRLAPPHQLAQLRPAIRESIVLEIKIQLRQHDMIDGTMRAVLDNARLPAASHSSRRGPSGPNRCFQTGLASANEPRRIGEQSAPPSLPCTLSRHRLPQSLQQSQPTSPLPTATL